MSKQELKTQTQTQPHVVKDGTCTSNTKADTCQVLGQFSLTCLNLLCPWWQQWDAYSDSDDVWIQRHTRILHALTHIRQSQSERKEKSQEKGQEKGQEKSTDTVNTVDTVDICEMSDIYCCQEFWCDSPAFVAMYEKHFANLGYVLHSLKRTASHKPDGVAMMINTRVFDVLNVQHVHFTVSNRVALVAVLKHKAVTCMTL